jgi:protein SCO1
MLIRNLIILIVIALLFSACEFKRILPKLGKIDLEYRVVNGKTITDTVFQKIPEFRFLNEDSICVSNKNFKNKIWIAEFFFASCPTICPVMNLQLKKLNKETRALNKHIQFLSFTIDPENDTPTILKDYKKRHRINAGNWTFLTGEEAETHALGINNFLTFAGKDVEAAGGYAHSGAFTLVDKEGIVRGVYEVTNFDLSVNKNEYARLKKDIFDLLKYEYNTTP